MSNLVGLLRRCADDYGMLQPGDKISVGLSGGKDSLTLLSLLAQLRPYHPSHFSLEAITIDLGMPGMDFSPLEKFCADLEVPFRRIPTEIGPILFDYRKEKNPCSMCAKMRRGALNKIVSAYNYDCSNYYDLYVLAVLHNLAF